jgi:hypothetical protein
MATSQATDQEFLILDETVTLSEIEFACHSKKGFVNVLEYKIQGAKPNRCLELLAEFLRDPDVQAQWEKQTFNDL